MAVRQRKEATGCVCRVPIAEVAALVGGPVEMALRQVHGGELGADWRGNDSVPVHVAARIVAEHRAAQEAQRERRARERADVEFDQLERVDIGNSAYAQAYDAFLAAHPTRANHGPGGAFGPIVQAPSRGVQEAAREAGRAAREEAWKQWDRRHGAVTA